MSTKDRSVALLLVFGPFAAGCGGDGNGDDGGSGETTTSVASTEGGSASTTTTTTGSTFTTASETGATDDATGTTMGDFNPICGDLGSKVLACLGRSAVYPWELSCNGAIDEAFRYSDECGVATEDYYACLSQLDCEAFMDLVGCEAEDDAAFEACGG